MAILSEEEVIRLYTTPVSSFAKEMTWKYLKPPPKIKISEWADKYRVLTTEDSPEAGKWMTAKAPYQKEPMDAICDSNVEQVVLQWGSQTGKTAGCLLNTLGYYMDMDPSPILFVYPTVTQAERVSRQRVSPMIRNCKALAEKIVRTTWRHGMDKGGSDSLLMKTYPGGMLIMGGADTPSSLSSFPMRIVLFDEIDRYKQDIGKGDNKEGEGDPIRLGITRTSNFWNRKIILSSTPTIKGSSRIEFAYEGSSQGHWHLPCPVCGHYQELQWHMVDYSSVPNKILGRCGNPECQQLSSKAKWIGGVGKWIHKYPERKTRGYYISTIPSPWFTWEGLKEEWIEANRAKDAGNTTLLKVFINTRLAQTFEDYAIRVQSHTIYERREVYPAEVPEGVLVLTCGADVQDIQKRINYEIIGWGKGYESWGIEYGTILADPREEEWKQLFDEMVYNRIFLFSDGKGIRVRKTLIDSNGAIGPYVYHYTRRRQPRIYSCKGSGHEQSFVGTFTGAYRLDKKYNTTWYPLYTIQGKDEMFQRLLEIDVGPGYCHFPMGPDEEDVRGYTNDYFIGLTSEQKRQETNSLGYPVFKYHKEGASRQSGEPLDCRVYARSALELVEQTMKLERMKMPDYTVQNAKELQNQLNNPFFTEKVVKTPQNAVKTAETNEYLAEMAENQPKTTRIAKNHPFFGQFGSNMLKATEFNPFEDR